MRRARALMALSKDIGRIPSECASERACFLTRLVERSFRRGRRRYELMCTVEVHRVAVEVSMASRPGDRWMQSDASFLDAIVPAHVFPNDRRPSAAESLRQLAGVTCRFLEFV